MYLRNYIIIVLCLLVISAHFAYSTEKTIPKTNTELSGELLQDYLNRTISFLRSEKCDSFYLQKQTGEDFAFIEKLIFLKTNENKITMLSGTPKEMAPKLEVWINELNIIYQNINDNDDSLQRIIKIDISGRYTGNDHNFKELPSVKINYKDVIFRDFAPIVKNSNYPFSNPQIPEKPSGWFKDFVQPLVIIGSAAVAVLLLFTVRTN